MAQRTRGWISEEERRRIRLEKEAKWQEDHLCRLARKYFKSTTTNKFAEKAGVSPGSAQKFKDNPFDMNFKVLQKCCTAAGIVLGVVNDE